ncbi:Hypothetical predicted protein [Paramuricea clavata]|uniref:Uncharacterized protein n=1 Tax=Paramuricea clavata TaxID=317549 RepID=A0A7D9IZQ3_PARCT|nr:Hypothetical predicted protein [Paramuricea clavata]
MAEQTENIIKKIKVLLQNKNSKKIATAASLEELRKEARQLFGLDSDSFLIQKYDNDFGEFVDVDDYNNISSGDKMHVVEEVAQSKGEVNEPAKSQDSININSSLLRVA